MYIEPSREDLNNITKFGNISVRKESIGLNNKFYISHVPLDDDNNLQSGLEDKLFKFSFNTSQETFTVINFKSMLDNLNKNRKNFELFLFLSIESLLKMVKNNNAKRLFLHSTDERVLEAFFHFEFEAITVREVIGMTAYSATKSI